MRKKRVYKKFHQPDVVHGRVELGRFINYVMKDGKKSTAEKLVYSAFDKIKETTKEEPMVVFERALENVMPLLEVASKRVGGANYQVPREVRPERRFVLALRWIIGAARAKKGKGMADKLADEIIAASKNEGNAIKKKLDMHRMAEANRAFAHFATIKKIYIVCPDSIRSKKLATSASSRTSMPARPPFPNACFFIPAFRTRSAKCTRATR